MFHLFTLFKDTSLLFNTNQGKRQAPRRRGSNSNFDRAACVIQPTHPVPHSSGHPSQEGNGSGNTPKPGLDVG